ncbi:BZ3500_MvSof-1268-A1-R1_Chr2-1g04657 [Microbotryum saponariae]|uniref:1-acyl-sn-glycerol-3-phosphate acyltransferase n=1 Tax=Microbotryum saponariae TaxID=289078 RepID=A0A2X0MKI5_9BASI|nr:BZ3500_MvSof-1268-A1-R1_Chr2-1g04657 [Microbotryum saponariae]SCZ92235.1 BZ3501_MvSof-1269-A2-R1_Chr2-1g04313 [Microbotryum saponariae]
MPSSSSNSNSSSTKKTAGAAESNPASTSNPSNGAQQALPLPSGLSSGESGKGNLNPTTTETTTNVPASSASAPLPSRTSSNSSTSSTSRSRPPLVEGTPVLKRSGATTVVGIVVGLAAIALVSMPASALSLSLSRQSSLGLGTLAIPLLLSNFKMFGRVRYYTRLTFFLLGLATCSAWGVVVSVVMALIGRASDVNYVVARSFHALVAPLVGVKFTVEGEEHLKQTKPAVVIGNHQTMIDILYLGRIFPKGTSIMAKKELKWTPLLGQFMTLSNAVFVNRSKRTDAVAMLAKVAQTMKEKVLSLFIFVEGTRSASPVPSMLPFKKGPFHLAVAAQLPIVPVVCENYAAVYSARRKRFDGGELVIRVLPPISTEGITSSSEDINALVEKTRNAMLEAIEDLGRRRAELNRLKGVFGKNETGRITIS